MEVMNVRYNILVFNLGCSVHILNLEVWFLWLLWHWWWRWWHILLLLLQMTEILQPDIFQVMRFEILAIAREGHVTGNGSEDNQDEQPNN